MTSPDARDTYFSQQNLLQEIDSGSYIDIPVVLQKVPKWTGAAALESVSKYKHRPIFQANVMRQFSMSSSTGYTLVDLIKIASANARQAQLFVLTKDNVCQLVKQGQPVIAALHVDTQMFYVVVAGCSGEGFIVMHPGIGTAYISQTDFFSLLASSRQGLVLN